MTSRTPRRHRRLALMAAGTAAAMVLLPGAASAQGIPAAQQVAGTTDAPAVPSDDPEGPAVPAAPGVPTLPGIDPALPGVLPLGTPSLTGSDDESDDEDDVERDDTPDSDQIDEPEPPDHASGAVAQIELLKSHLLDITKYDATIEDDDSAHSDSTVLALGGERIIGSSASSDGEESDGDNPTSVLCEATGGVLCLSLLYHDVFASEEEDEVLAAARGGVLALCLLGDDDDVTATYDCDGLLSLGVAEGVGIAERDKKHGHTTAESANELVNLCVGKRDDLLSPCDGLGLQVLHSESESESEEPSTDRASWLIGIDSNGSSTYILDEPTALVLPDGCGDEAILCLLLNQGKSVIFKNPQGAGSAQEALRLDVLNRLLLVVLGQSETLVHETDGKDDHDKSPECSDKVDNDEDGHTDYPDDKDCDSEDDDSEHGDEGHDGKGGDHGDDDGLAKTGADVTPLLAGGFLLAGLGALTVAATRRRVGKHSV